MLAHEEMLRELVNRVLDEQPSSFQNNNIRFIRRQNGDYLVALIDTDLQAKTAADGKLAVVFCKCKKKDLLAALRSLSSM